ncbi:MULTISPECIES: hypothetical protein [Yersinia]|uniref:hypothetical protein n=1 Tax=Yersinia TaxID=629 RepID=UPI0021BDCE64|nr:hypothetical protein [Yersinia rohdei]
MSVSMPLVSHKMILPSDNCFIGTAGDLLLNAASQLFNSGMLYSCGNKQLLVDRITSHYCDILADKQSVDAERHFWHP